jgi:toxin ParE2
MTIRLLRVAQSEFDEAVEWYNAQAPGMGDAFLIESLRVFRLIEQSPYAWHQLSAGIHRCRLARFPYGVIYSPDGGSILVTAIAHLHRAPTYWKSRAKGES